MVLIECYRQVLKNWFGTEENRRKFIDKIIETLKDNWNRKNIFVIEAPTGYGKSTISATVALYSLKDPNSLKCIIAFPLRTLIEDQYCKFVGEYKENNKAKCVERRSILGNIDQNHRLKIIGKRYMHNPDSRYLIKPITLTTVDTLALTLFGIPPEHIDKVIRAWDGTIGGSLGHYLFSWGSVVFSNIVLDEVHLLADSTKSLSFLIALMKIAKDFDQKLILMSATLPETLKSILQKYIPEIEFIEFNINDDPEFYEERIKKEYDVILEKVTDQDKFEKILSWIKENKEFSRVIIIFNTVQEAIDFYNKKIDELREIFGDKIVILHSRFSEQDREGKIKSIQNLGDRYLIISTQVIEAGVDISSNLFITDIAPANSLIQRLGRFLRYTNEGKGKVIIWYESEEEHLKVTRENKERKFYKVYDYDLTLKTLKWLNENSKNFEGKRLVNLNVHLPETKGENKKGYRDLLNFVYSKNEIFKVDEEKIRDFEGIFLHLENASLVAVEKFFEMEGSFVRDELQIPVVSKAKVDELKNAEGFISENPVDFVRKYVVSISFDSFRRRDQREIKGVVRIEEMGNGRIKPKYFSKDEDSWLLSILERKEVQPRDILRYVLVKDVLAFVIDAKYDEELGLRFDKHD